MARTLFLIGFMASGKSSLGKKLAKHFAMDFIDLDKEIEQAESKSINALFEDHDEDYFRELESKVLRSMKLENKIVATGGGTPIFHHNMAFMKEKGAVAYMVVPTEIIIGRLRQNKEERPLVRKLSDEDLTTYVEKTLEQRKIIYSKADILIPHTKSFSLLKMELGFLLN
ncbi:MAG: shikimate kinase [Chitinophagales bacterium]|nr:shikimate kinase [Chitinophagales bacterium]